MSQPMVQERRAPAAGREIPLIRLDDADPALMSELLDAVRRVASTAGFVLGEEVAAFEREWAAYCGVAHAVGVSSGTDALALALRGLGVGPGDEVLVPANSFIGTAEAVSLVGARPRFVDVDESTGLITAAHVEAATGPRTCAVIPVHLYGRSVELEPILVVARARGLAVIEDACQAHGASIAGRRVGSLGDAGCFSFYPAKNLGAWGDAGAVVSNDPRLAERVRLMRAHGERIRHRHELVGTTARLDALQAAILRIKLRRLDEWNERRRRLGGTLTQALRSGPVAPPPPPVPGGDHVFHQFVVRSDDRDALRSHLAARGIATAIHYPVPLHRTPAYAPAGREVGPLPVAEALAGRICSLPIHPRLNEREVARIVSAVIAFQRAARRATAPA
jgi:dTDP-4-amino-4,6-dideoxygalactose transaminase